MEYIVLNSKGIIHSDYLNEDIYNNLDCTFIIPESYSYDVLVVTKNYIARPDLISYEVYGDTMYADIICKLNGISNPFELNEGMALIMPTMEYISQFSVHPDKITDNDENWGNDSNIEASESVGKKTKNSDISRRVNDATNGDVGYTIDTNNRIIIY